MKRHVYICTCLVFLLTSTFLNTQTNATPADVEVAADCVPFNSRPVRHPIDTSCGLEGNAPATKPMGQEQNRRKNNLCATGTLTNVSLDTLGRLHQAVVTAHGFSFGSDSALNQNTSRGALERIQTLDAHGRRVVLGEGKVVRLQAFVLEAKHDDIPLLDRRFRGEGVNCKDLTPEGNDIHIALVESADLVERFRGGDRRVECGSVTAEIIPHLRPATWNRFDSHPRTSPDPSINGLPVQGLEVRLTGQLFFDASHDPANCKAPRRRSSWEIHPVYTIEVKDGNNFISFDEWASRQTEPERNIRPVRGGTRVTRAPMGRGGRRLPVNPRSRRPGA